MSYGSPPPPPEYGAPDPNQQPPYGQQYPAYGQGGQPPGYGGYGAPGGYQPAPQTSPMAIISLIAGIASIVLACCCTFLSLVGVAGIICGVLARKEIAESHGSKTGAGMALAGIITGAVGIALGIVSVLLIFVFGAFDYGYYDY